MITYFNVGVHRGLLPYFVEQIMTMGHGFLFNPSFYNGMKKEVLSLLMKYYKKELKSVPIMLDSGGFQFLYGKNKIAYKKLLSTITTYWKFFEDWDNVVYIELDIGDEKERIERLQYWNRKNKNGKVKMLPALHYFESDYFLKNVREATNGDYMAINKRGSKRTVENIHDRIKSAREAGFSKFHFLGVKDRKILKSFQPHSTDITIDNLHILRKYSNENMKLNYESIKKENCFDIKKMLNIDVFF